MKVYSCLIIMILSMTFFTGCIRKDVSSEKEKVSYAVCKRSVLPKELARLIDEEKKEAFHFTYTVGAFSYYVTGYGSQQGRGYSIKVNEVTADKEHIYIDTTLVGVTMEKQKKGISYPYVVIKTQNYEKEAVFR